MKYLLALILLLAVSSHAESVCDGEAQVHRPRYSLAAETAYLNLLKKGVQWQVITSQMLDIIATAPSPTLPHVERSEDSLELMRGLQRASVKIDPERWPQVASRVRELQNKNSQDLSAIAEASILASPIWHAYPLGVVETNLTSPPMTYFAKNGEFFYAVNGNNQTFVVNAMTGTRHKILNMNASDGVNAEFYETADGTVYFLGIFNRELKVIDARTGLAPAKYKELNRYISRPMVIEVQDKITIAGVYTKIVSPPADGYLPMIDLKTGEETAMRIPPNTSRFQRLSDGHIYALGATKDSSNQNMLLNIYDITLNQPVLNASTKGDRLVSEMSLINHGGGPRMVIQGSPYPGHPFYDPKLARMWTPQWMASTEKSELFEPTLGETWIATVTGTGSKRNLFVNPITSDQRFHFDLEMHPWSAVFNFEFLQTRRGKVLLVWQGHSPPGVTVVHVCHLGSNEITPVRLPMKVSAQPRSHYNEKSNRVLTMVKTENGRYELIQLFGQEQLR